MGIGSETKVTISSNTPETKIGNIVYARLQSNEKISAAWLIEKLKASEPDWFFNQELFNAISERLNKLGCEPDESQIQFIQYLHDDPRFTSLAGLASTIPTLKIAQIVYTQLKSKGSLTPDWFLAALKADDHDWHYQQALAVDITERLNQLHNQKKRSLTQFERTLENDADLIALLEQSEPVLTKKFEETAIEAATLGNIVYPQFKVVETITTAWLLAQVQQAGLDWYYPEELAIQITDRLNALGVYKNVGLEQFNQHLTNDLELTHLLAQSITIELKEVGQIRQLPEEPPTLIGRDELLLTLLKYIIRNKSDDRHLLLRGTGGVGKTMICQSLAHRCVVTGMIKDILWINGDSGLAHHLRHFVAPAYQVDEKDANWLKHLMAQLKRAATPSVMFIDNFDDSEENLDILTQLKQLHWSIIATSRSKSKLFSRTNTVGELNLKQCVDLFEHHYGDVKPESMEILEALIKLAGRHTLTIELLAKISSKGNLSIGRLYKQVRSVGFNLSHLTSTKIKAKHSGTEPQSTHQWELHQHLSKLFDFAKIKPSFKVVMRTLAVLPHQIYDCHKQLVPWLSLRDDSIIVGLADRGWLQNAKAQFRMHPVIGHVAKGEIPLRVKYLEQVAERFNQSIQPKDNELWISKAIFTPHLLAMSKYLEEGSDVKCELQFSLACIYQVQSDFYKAEELFVKVLAIREKVYGKNSEKLLDNLNHLARLYRALNELEKAEQCSQRSLDISKNRLGEDHVTTAVAMGDLGNVYRLKGDYIKSFRLYRRVADINEAKLAPTHPHVAMSLSRVGDLLKSLGKHQEALTFYEKSLNIRKQNHDAKHVSIAAASHDLGMLYQLLDRFDEAKVLFEEALEINQEIIGQQSHEVSEVLNSIGNLQLSQKNIQTALSHFEQSLNIREKIFGKQHTKIVPTLENIASLHVQNGTLSVAVDFYMRALKVNQRFFGTEHICVYNTLTELGRMYVKRRDKDWTEQEFWQCCNERERFYGDGGEFIFVAKHHCVATAYYQEGQKYKNSPNKAVGLHTKGLELRKKLLPSTHDGIKQSLEALVDVHKREGKILNALPYYEQIVVFMKEKYGEENLHVAKYLAEIAPTFQHQGKVDAAMGFYNQAIEIMEGELGHDDPLTKEMVKRRVQLRGSMR